MGRECALDIPCHKIMSKGNHRGFPASLFGDHKTLAIFFCVYTLADGPHVLRYYTLHYYLADDTAEILENMSRPGSRDLVHFLLQAAKYFVASDGFLDLKDGFLDLNSELKIDSWKTTLSKLVGRLLPDTPGNE